MTFLMDADLPRSAADVVRRHGHDAVDVRDIGLRHADDSVIASHAQREHQCLVTGDCDFADCRNYPSQQYAGIVVLPPSAMRLP
jgi:predicted nuclease of predicted toxin-antitoxin system